MLVLVATESAASAGVEVEKIILLTLKSVKLFGCI